MPAQKIEIRTSCGLNNNNRSSDVSAYLREGTKFFSLHPQSGIPSSEQLRVSVWIPLSGIIPTCLKTTRIHTYVEGTPSKYIRTDSSNIPHGSKYPPGN